MSIGPIFKSRYGPALKTIRRELLVPSSPAWKKLVKEVEAELSADHKKVLIMMRLQRQAKGRLTAGSMAARMYVCRSVFFKMWAEIRLYALLRAVQAGLLKPEAE